MRYIWSPFTATTIAVVAHRTAPHRSPLCVWWILDVKADLVWMKRAIINDRRVSAGKMILHSDRPMLNVVDWIWLHGECRIGRTQIALY